MKGKMKGLCKRVIASACAMTMVLSGMLSDLGSVVAQAAGEHTMWLVGDSTVCEFSDNYYYPRYGYGTQVGNYLDDSYVVNNIAASGRSSKSFLVDSKDSYAALTSGIKSGDVLVIGFGHNDEKGEEARYTNPNGDYQTEGSFAKSLYDNYVKVAKDAGAEVILCTPICRRSATGTLSDANTHITADAAGFPGGDYPAAIRKLGQDVDVPVVDLTALTKNLYNQIGASETLAMHAWTSEKEGSVDNTHLNIYGAKKVAYMFAEAAAKTSTELAKHIDLTAGEPTKEKDLTSNPNYVIKTYDGNLADSAIFSDYVVGDVHFKGTAFGDLGGNPSATNHILGTDDNGNMHIAVKSNKGKISGTSDGIVMYYYKVPVGSNFVLSAKATVNGLDLTNSQVAFGLMARDDMYIDTNDKSIKSDYVVAGSLGQGSNCFYRKNGTIGGKGTFSKEKLAVGGSYNLNIASNSDGYACKFGEEDALTGGYDFQLTSVDSDYVYVGMFAARNADITYSNIYLEIDGKVIVDTRKTENTITVSNDGNGTGSANTTKASAGDVITLTATPATGYEFKEWEVVSGDITIEDNTFTMIAADVEVKAIFKKSQTPPEEGPATVQAGDIEFKSKNTIAAGVKGMAFAGFQDTTTGHGIHSTADEATVVLSLSEKANITVETCRYGAGTAGTMTASSGKVSSTEIDENGANGLSFVVAGSEAGELTLTFAKDMYIHKINVEYIKAVGPRVIDVWDFGGLVESNTDKYTSYMNAENIIKSGMVAKGGTMAAGNFEFGDMTAVVTANDRLYTNCDGLSEYNKGAYAMAQFAFDDGYTSVGAWYCNGTGGATRRYLTISNVQAGDKIVVYGGISQSGPSQMIIEGQGAAGPQKEVYDVEAGKLIKMEFVAEKTGTYKVYESGSGKPFYNRVMRIPAVKVTGTIDFGTYSGTGHSLKFINQTTQAVTEATLDGNKFEVALGAGYSYTATFSGASGFGLKNSCKDITTTVDQALTGVKDVALVVEPKQTIKYTGSIKGIDSAYDVSKLSVVMKADPLSNEDNVTLTIAKDMTFTADLQPEIEYTAELIGVNDYEITDGAKVNTASDKKADITVALKKVYDVKGSFTGLENGAKVTALTFVNVEDNYKYTATVIDGGYSIKLRNGSYATESTVEGHTGRTHVVVKDGNVNKDLMYVSTAELPPIDKVKDVYVGYPNKTNNYDTVSAAMRAIDRMNISSEADRVTVHIAPGTYREQILVKSPYVTFVNDTNEEVLLTWYYGIGYTYYSSDSSGYYNPENAYDKYDKHIANRWGVAVYVKSTATAFRAEGITFENSFNRYITDEELEDGVEVATCPVVRNYGVDVTTKAATERAAALCVEGANSEFKNCKFYSSQDTLYTQANCYFKDCFIEGQTDYIFGSGNVVFDTCELSFKGYSANSQGGYITANRPASGSEKGYLFRNCTITANKDPKLTVTPGNFGRPWGADATVYFINTKLETASIITAKAYDDMSGATPEKANYNEYNTTAITGEKVDTSARRGKVMTAEQASAIKAEDFFGSWTPVYYQAAADTVKFVVKPAITDNGDLNTPYPGHTLTVGYSLGKENDANDASIILWYAVKDGKETLLKSATAATSKSYKIAKTDVGAKIKVTVIPENVNAVKGTAESCTTDSVVLDGYEDPSNKGADAVLGDGVNVFLAGDSTVKDYRASGIFSGNSARNEGSWGEYLQEFFNGEKVTVVNYANGGRSTRNYINEGTLDTIASKIKAGDYLFIQFGHNDCSDGESYLADRYVPVGTPDANGIYPVTPGKKVPRPAELNASYGETCYTWDCGGTYKWYLKQFIDVAKAAGATPVLVTPVSRLYYNADGTIKPHHQDSKTTNNSYVTAVKQLGEEEGVLVIDAFSMTKDLFEKAYKDGGNKDNGTMLMNTGESTHNNKLGGFIEAALIADAILDAKIDNKPISIATAVKTPARVLGTTTDGKTVVSVDKDGKLKTYNILKEYAEESAYWNGEGQAMLDALAAKIAKIQNTVEKTDISKFKDVEMGKWYIEGIQYVNDHGIMTGYEDGTGNFGVKDSLIRAQFATMLYRMAGKPSVQFTGKFKDVVAGKYYSEAVEWCATNGIVTGYQDGSNLFGYKDNIQRQQIAVMLYRYANNEGRDVSGRASLEGFTDGSDVSTYAKEAISWCVAEGILTGKDNKNGTFTLDPKGDATRAECATMIMRYMSK